MIVATAIVAIGLIAIAFVAIGIVTISPDLRTIVGPIGSIAVTHRRVIRVRISAAGRIRLLLIRPRS